MTPIIGRKKKNESSVTGVSINNSISPSNIYYQSFADIHHQYQDDHHHHLNHDDNEVLIHVVSSDPSTYDSTNSWQPLIQDLDFFLSSVYRFHSRSGLTCIVVDSLLSLIQFLFILFFSIFVIHMINYHLIFNHQQLEPNKKITIRDVILPVNSIILSPFEIFLLVFAAIYFVYRVLRSLRNISINISINNFFKNVLKVKDVNNYTWNEIMSKLIVHQRLFNLSDNKTDTSLTELDIINRIMRHDNYLIALMNRGLIPVHFRLIGTNKSITHFNNNFLWNLKFLLFKSPFSSLFETNWRLKSLYRDIRLKEEASKTFARNCKRLALLNLIFSPLIFLFSLLNSFFVHAEAVKRDPSGTFGARVWSVYTRIFCRHFNELDHSLNERLDRGFKSAVKFCDSFSDPLTVIIARHLSFISSSILAVLLLLTIYDEDVLSVEHVLSIMTVLGVIIAISHSFSDDNRLPPKYSREELYSQTLKHLHYLPSFGPSSKDYFNNVLFQYRIVFLVESLISPLITPFILYFSLSNKSNEIIDFFRNFTVEVTGVGDVCSFALMNFKRNGNKQVFVDITDDVEQDVPEQVDQPVSHHDTTQDMNMNTSGGKLELSLVNFQLQNPNWNPNHESLQKDFLDFVKKGATSVDEMTASVFSRERSRLLSSSLINRRVVNVNEEEEEERNLEMTLSTLFLHDIQQQQQQQQQQQTRNTPSVTRHE